MSFEASGFHPFKLQNIKKELALISPKNPEFRSFVASWLSLGSFRHAGATPWQMP
jgi:hypothetical protein